jgi:hypothetical protein
MDLSPYVESLRRELVRAAEGAEEEARAAAERAAFLVESSARLAMLEVLSAAADEITRDLAPGSVRVWLRGRDPQSIVTPGPSGVTGAPSGVTGGATTGAAGPGGGESAERAGASAGGDAEDSAMVRVALRLPEHLKTRVEEAAGRDGLSVNAWLVRAATRALDDGGTRRMPPGRPAEDGGNRYTGWVR